MTAERMTADAIHRERAVEDHFVASLVGLQGWRRRPPEAFDRRLALDIEMTEEFLRTTQPEAWKRLEDYYPGRARQELGVQIAKRLAAVGTLEVLRKGVKIVPNISFDLCAFRPASGLGADLVRLYEANVLSVMRQVRYSLKSENAIDMVAFVNGLPVATFEIKNTLTGTTFRDAEQQYRKDRAPEGEPLLTFKRGALVHFALDEDSVSMTTRLMNGRTRFLPFNRGAGGGAGNPDIAGDHRTAYLWRDLTEGRAIFSREVLLDIIGNFASIAREKKPGAKKHSESLIWPRFHQLDAVRRIAADAALLGAGQSYLVQHSAGSGKSNTIAWTAHKLASLHDALDRATFDGVIIVTDRVVLDRQLQETVASFEQDTGVVTRIDGTSRQLREALEAGARIIISTIQKFSTDTVRLLSGMKGKRFAVIIDEAHSSQSGKQAGALSDALTRDEVEAQVDDVEAAVAALQSARGPQANISYLAFTATPRNVTLERFGRRGLDGMPQPFHLYAMRQAIEEGFILDVLQNYMTYKAYYELEKVIDEDPRFEGRRAARAVARFAALHPTAMAQKAQVIVEHFRRHVLPELEGDAKAMVVTASREHAIRTYQAIAAYTAENGYADVRAIVAFSGEKTIDNIEYTEAGINGFSETQLPDKFAGPGINILVVAEKYQTGFDQPKLVGMYVDKKLDGLQAVQTLSRLNRTHPGKDRTFILDFQNGIDDIREAFKPYFEATELEALSDPNQLYDLVARIDAFGLIQGDEVDRFCALFFRGGLTSADRPTLDQIVRLAVARYVALDDEDRQEEYRQLIASFLRFYAFVAQVVPLADLDLEKLYAYASWLKRALPSRAAPHGEAVTDDMLTLKAFRLKKDAEGSGALAPGEGERLKPITEFGAKGYTEEEERALSEIINSFNARFGSELTEADFVRFEQVNSEILDDEDMVALIRYNAPDVARGPYGREFRSKAVRAFKRGNQMQSAFLSDEELRERLISFMFGRALREALASR